LHSWALACLALLLAGAGQRCGFADEIHVAIRSNDINRVHAILETGGPEAVNAIIGEGVTPLHLASALNLKVITGLLLFYKADINAKTAGGFTPLHWAASRDAVDAAGLLIAAGADVNAKTPNGITPLHWAASKNAVKMIRLLLEHGADLNSTTEKGLTPLHWAIMHGSSDAAMLLAYETVSREMDKESQAETATAPPPVPKEMVLETLAAMPEPPPSSERPAREEAPLPPPPPLTKYVPGKLLLVDLGFHQVLEFVWIDKLRIWVGKYEVTNGQYRRFKPTHNSGARENITLNGDDQPVVMVSWEDAQAYIAWLNRNYRSNLPKGCRFRLPTELEWILLAKCGDNRKYPWGNQWPPAYGNFSDLSARRLLADWHGIRGYDDGYPVTCPVTESGCNEWGICGLAGNVWEWCEDWYDSSRRYKVRHGGSWDFDQEPNLRIDARGFDRPDARYDTIGFRLIVSEN